MKVKELIERLSDMDEEKEVLFSYNYGDHCHTMVAAQIYRVEESEVVHSEYHRMKRIVDDDEERKIDSEVVVVIW